MSVPTLWQLCGNTNNTVLIENNGVSPDWGCNPFWVTPLLPAATKLGQGNIFIGVCQEFCSQRGGGGLPQCMLGYHHHHHPLPWQADTPPGRQTLPPREADPPHQAEPPGRQADPSPIRSMSGRYASYWNAFLFSMREESPASSQSCCRVDYAARCKWTLRPRHLVASLINVLCNYCWILFGGHLYFTENYFQYWLVPKERVYCNIFKALLRIKDTCSERTMKSMLRSVHTWRQVLHQVLFTLGVKFCIVPIVAQTGRMGLNLLSVFAFLSS